MDLDFSKMGGLIPAVIQEERGGKVLMLGYMNEPAFHSTIRSGRITFFSRSKNRLWTKGETSGNFLELVSWSKDCDSDSLLFQVTAAGPVCHLDRKSCFENTAVHRGDFQFLHTLEGIIDLRGREASEGSYTSQLMQAGLSKVAQKIGEEAVEVVIALMGNSGREMIDESADLIFHLLLGLRTKGIDFRQVVERLEERHKARV
ncbi:MAG: bifunctional phosphoribosyl-AMP cyclohydrolase/phosphoribosyl-ATP diphosphatase HisIE [Proteobacteria bacterium]|nr:MAG: bifunctional phosphoribosyl-AMP cyclohydrolase/phosphoribosyl-ATP diphosphatase HisIE [Pseudomonadota bacterium]